jgi:hypothetical protein
MNSHVDDKQDFIWLPGKGPDEDARQRLIKTFSKPSEPMGEAWFMGASREMYSEALTVPAEDLDNDVVDRMFEAIVGGPPCFGQLEEWRDWFHYLLPRLVPLALRQRTFSYIAEWLAGGTFSQHPDGLEDGSCRGFRGDVLATLGHVLMSQQIWDNGRLKWNGGLFSESRRYEMRSWYLDRVSPPISVMLFFCLKYLRPRQIEAWWASVIHIDCPLWRAQLMVWLTGAQPIITGIISQPSQFDEPDCPVQWEWSHALSGQYPEGEVPFIPLVNLHAFESAVKLLLPTQVRTDLVSQVLDVPLLKSEMGWIAEGFVDLDLGIKA